MFHGSQAPPPHAAAHHQPGTHISTLPTRSPELDKHTSRWPPYLHRCSNSALPCFAAHCATFRCHPSLFLNWQESSSLSFEVDKLSSALAEGPCLPLHSRTGKTLSVTAYDSSTSAHRGLDSSAPAMGPVWLSFPRLVCLAIDRQCLRTTTATHHLDGRGDRGGQQDSFWVLVL